MIANQKDGPSQLWVLRYRAGAVATPLHRDAISARGASAHLKVQDLAAAISVAHAPRRSAKYHGHAAAIIAGRDPQLHSPWLDLNRPPGSQEGPKRAGRRGRALNTEHMYHQVLASGTGRIGFGVCPEAPARGKRHLTTLEHVNRSCEWLAGAPSATDLGHALARQRAGHRSSML